MSVKAFQIDLDRRIALDDINEEESNSIFDPITQLMAGTGMLHEFFTSCVESGFTEKQALQLIANMITGSRE